MRFRQISNDEVPSILCDTDLWMCFIDKDTSIQRKKVCKILPEMTSKYVADTRYMFGYFEGEETDGR